jgi:ASPIC and UnbV.
LVRLVTSTRTQIRPIDAGSGYLCQMEPVAHFGLGSESAVEAIQIQWPDGKQVQVAHPPVNQLLRIPYPG